MTYSKLSVGVLMFLTLSSFAPRKLVSGTDEKTFLNTNIKKDLNSKECQSEECQATSRNEKLKKFLVVYYSRSGNTKMVAEKLASTIKCDIIEITEPQSRKGLWNLFTSGYEALTKKQPTIIYPKIDYQQYSSVFVGTPVWAASVSTPIRSYLKEYANETSSVPLPPVYKLFYTCGGTPHSLLEPGLLKEAASITGGKAPAAIVGMNGNELQTTEVWEAKLTAFAQDS